MDFFCNCFPKEFLYFLECAAFKTTNIKEDITLKAEKT